MIKKFQTRHKIATYFTRSITLVIGALTFGILFQSYHMSSSLIAQEVERTAKQTANLQQRVFDSRLALLKIHQDSSASNPELIQAIAENNHHRINRFFKYFDQLDPDNTPDFRFIADLTQPDWDDGSSEFYGIRQEQLGYLFNAVSLNSYWNIVRLKSAQNNVYVLARRAPIVSPISGEVLGYLVVSFLLNDNFHLIEELRTRSHSQNLVLSIDDEVLSSTISGKESYSVNDILHSDSLYNFQDAIFINKTHLHIDDIPTQLTIYSVQNNYNIKKLRNNFYYTIIFTVIAMLSFSYILWKKLHNRIHSEIETLMGFTYAIADKGTDVSFGGSSIAEFDHIGRVLEHTFHRLSDAEKQSRLATIEAEKAASIRADFLARMSHEVRTPLNGILGVAQLLKTSLHDDKHREQVGVLCACSEHLLAVLNDILDFSKLEYGNFQINKSAFDLIDTINAIEKMYRPVCDEKGLIFSIDHNLKNNTYVYSDQVRLNQIIFNLLNNAVKFTANGCITVKLNFCFKDHKSGTLNVEVSDTGIGIEENEQESIFQPFVQSYSGLSKSHGGTGLGLSIVKNLVELLGGSITLHSVVDCGSTFKFEIPIALVEKQGSQLTINEPDTEKLSFDVAPKVLLVEDNKTNAFIAKAFCEKFGLVVTWVMDGEEAIKIASQSEFDLILMDNQLPNKDGVEITRILRQQYKLLTPIFACTADGSKETQEAFLTAGADFIIVKPIREGKIYQALLFFKTSYYSS